MILTSITVTNLWGVLETFVAGLADEPSDDWQGAAPENEGALSDESSRSESSEEDNSDES
jgi:hypothetical protein